MDKRVSIEQAPNGKWFVSFMGWGRCLGYDEAVARDYAENHHLKGA